MTQANETGQPAVKPLLTEAAFRAALGGICERKFKELRAAGVVPPPLELGPRVARWTADDFEAAVQRLPRREAKGEPDSLRTARRAYIERAKSGARGRA